MKMIFDLKLAPYSVRGSDLALIDNKGLKVHSSIQKEGTPFASIHFFINKKEVFPEYEVETDLVTAKKGNAVCKICFWKKGAMAIENTGFDLLIEPKNCEKRNMYRDLFYTYGIECADGHFETVSCNENYFIDYYFVKGKGCFVRKKPLLFDKSKKGNCMKITGDASFFLGLSDEQQRFDDVPFDLVSMRKEVEDNWQNFLASMPSVPEKYREFAQMTWFTIWSNMVPKSRHYERDTVVMGMVGMPAIWSWDHCFNALSTAVLKS